MWRGTRSRSQARSWAAVKDSPVAPDLDLGVQSAEVRQPVPLQPHPVAGPVVVTVRQFIGLVKDMDRG
jgi:hypothetical protein